MEITKVQIEGKNLSKLVPALQDVLAANNRKFYLRKMESTSVLGIEEFYFRIGSTLLTVISFHFVGSTCEAEIVSGGGSKGLLDITWGAEESSIHKMIKALQSVCEQISLKMQVQGE